MTLLGTVHLLGRFVGNTIDVVMTVLAGIATVWPTLKQLIIDIEQPEFTLFIDAAQAAVFVTDQAVEFFRHHDRLTAE